MESIVEIAKNVLERLTTIGYEKNGLVSSGQLIFPSKSDVKRISEQELRQLFIEEFRAESNNLYYSIETPTVNRYSFTNKSKVIKVADDVDKGQSALIDMCVFEKKDEKSEYTRHLNIEFKHKNATKDNITKDILKLMHEKESGAFIVLLKNTNTGTLNNLVETRFGVIDKLSQSFEYHKSNQVQWNGGDEKFIEIVILSLEEKENGKGQPFVFHSKISKIDLDSLNNSKDNWKKEILVNGVYQSNDVKKISLIPQ